MQFYTVLQARGLHECGCGVVLHQFLCDKARGGWVVGCSSLSPSLRYLKGLFTDCGKGSYHDHFNGVSDLVISIRVSNFKNGEEDYRYHLKMVKRITGSRKSEGKIFSSGLFSCLGYCAAAAFSSSPWRIKPLWKLLTWGFYRLSKQNLKLHLINLEWVGHSAEWNLHHWNSLFVLINMILFRRTSQLPFLSPHLAAFSLILLSCFYQAKAG